MKKFYILLAVINLILITGNKAQNYIPQPVQLVHNSSDASIPQLKIWINDTIWINSLSFQQASAKKTFASGVYTVGVSLPTATAQTQSIAQQTFELGNGIDSQFLMINGIVGDALHPLIISNLALPPLGQPGLIHSFFYFHNGCTDYNSVAVSCPAGSSGTLLSVNNISYTHSGRLDFSYNTSPGANNTVTVAISSGTISLGNYAIPLGNYLEKNVEVIMNNYSNSLLKGANTGFGMSIVPITGGSITPMSKIEVPNGLNESSINDIHIAVFPNPAHDLLTVSLNGASNDEIRLRVLDVAGSTIITQSSLQAPENTINVKSLSSGIYFLTITQGNASKTVKFVKN